MTLTHSAGGDELSDEAEVPEVAVAAEDADAAEDAEADEDGDGDGDGDAIGRYWHCAPGGSANDATDAKAMPLLPDQPTTATTTPVLNSA